MTDSKLVGRDILKRDNAQRKEIPIPEWDGSVLIRQLSSREVNDLQTLASEAVDPAKGTIRDRKKLSRFNFGLICASWITADGERVLANTEEDYEMLVAQPHAVLTLLNTEISEFNKLDATSQAQAKKNSPVTQNGASGTN